MNKFCPNPHCAFPFNLIRDGYFRRKDDSKIIQRYRCKTCGKRFSNATFSESYFQKKRRINFTFLKHYSSGLSISRSALLLGVNVKTISRRVAFLGKKCRRLNEKMRDKRTNIQTVVMDDLITKENSKLKPLSVSIAVDENRRHILGVEVSQIPAFGHLSKIALRKYGSRANTHPEALDRLFKSIAPMLSREVLIKTDEHTSYPYVIRKYLPRSKHEAFRSERAHVAGQGELKKVSFDPLFVINHTCAMLRANINRLIRRTWCTTKKIERLKDHLEIFQYYYNEIYLKGLTPI